MYFQCSNRATQKYNAAARTTVYKKYQSSQGVNPKTANEIVRAPLSAQASAARGHFHKRGSRISSTNME
jgi:hypothetical protein